MVMTYKTILMSCVAVTTPNSVVIYSVTMVKEEVLYDS